MLYYLCKLDFLTALHIGDSSSARSLETSKMAFGADTLFSALCHEALSLGGTTMLEQLYQLTKEDKLLLSDSLPYHGETLYLPRPVAPATIKIEGDPKLRKKYKKMSYLPVALMDRYLAYLRGEADFEVRLAEDEARAGELGDLPVVHTKFGVHSTVAKVAVQGRKDPEPFHVGTFSFFMEDKKKVNNKPRHETCGLYIIIGYAEDGTLPLVLRLLKSLAGSGIGGKTSAGYGKFTIGDEIFIDEVCDEQTEWLKRSLHYQTAKSFLLLNLALPKEDEMPGAVEGSTYALERRGGFVQSTGYGTTFYKKKTGYLFAAGSVFRKTFQGDVFDVAVEGAHPVYRYGKPLFLGVDL
jgi:CRISPR-associated protein Csm4